jgi:hypothetical protein
MATKASKTPAAKKPKAKKAMVATFPDPPDKDKADAIAKMALRPSVNAAVVMVSYTNPLGEVDIGALVNSLSAGMDDLWAGDMKRVEAMLYGQAHALQAIFMNLARRAASQEYLKQWEAYLRMAMKAQNQCRMTLETLATIKNPPVVIARQANINNGGQQQVNNGAQPGPAAAQAPATGVAGDGGLESPGQQALETSPMPTQGIFPPVESNSKQSVPRGV